MKRKWDNENVMDYAIKTAKEEVRDEEQAKAEQEKKEMARQMLTDKFPVDQIAKYTKLSLDEIKVL